MHDPANLDAILNVVATLFVVWMIVAVVGAAYLGLKWGGLISRRGSADQTQASPDVYLPGVRPSPRARRFGYLVMALLAIAALALVILFESV